jgi:hypothetical protein
VAALVGVGVGFGAADGVARCGAGEGDGDGGTTSGAGEAVDMADGDAGGDSDASRCAELAPPPHPVVIATTVIPIARRVPSLIDRMTAPHRADACVGDAIGPRL